MFSKVKNYCKENGVFKTIKYVIKGAKNRVVQKVNCFKSTHSKVGNVKDYDSSQKKVYMFACVPYFDVGGGQRSASLSKAFKKLGYNIVYLYALPTSESKIYKLDYPTVVHKYIKKYNIKEFEKTLNKDDLVIFEMPIDLYLPYLKIAKNKCKTVYENIDNWEDNLGNRFFNKNVLKEFLECDVLTSTATLLKKQMEDNLKMNKMKKEVLYLPNAVNDELFNPKLDYEKPSDLISGDKTLLYYGSLWLDCFDWEIIKNVAKSNENYSINLIGDDKMLGNKKDNLPKNIHFLGLKKQTELPAYLKYSDYAMYPFKIDETGAYVSPLKIFEYISMQKQILSTDSEEIKSYPGVYCSDDYKKWIEVIERKNKYDKEKASDFINKNNWISRCKSLIDAFEKIKSAKCEVNPK